ncbi:MAG: hypothetical protein Kilf2KO_16500 [Rhodospirillales bacterium]
MTPQSDGSSARRWSPQRQAVADYKALLRAIIDRRPSGLRGRLAEAMGKNRSFVSQIANPAYDTPVPARHLETIFRIAHVSQEERAAFMAAYERAHPDRPAPALGARRQLLLHLPDLGEDSRNRQLDLMLQDFADQLARLMVTQDERAQGDQEEDA